MIELVLGFYEFIEAYDSECNREKLKKNNLFLKNKICADGVCNSYNCER